MGANVLEGLNQAIKRIAHTIRMTVVDFDSLTLVTIRLNYVKIAR